MESFAATIGSSIYAVFVDSQRVGIRRYEDGGSAEVALRLTPEVQALLERCCELLRSLMDRYESKGGQGDEQAAELELSEEDNLFALVPSAPRSPEAVLADVAFMANAELVQHQQRLAAHHGGRDVQEMISDCGSALRGIKKSLYAVEPLLCEVERIPPLLPSHLETSLKVRRHYRKLWMFASEAGEITPEGVRAALRGAGTRISILAGSEVYSLLREDDRFYIRELQVRVLEWLRSGTDQQSAIRIWQDFALFVEILRQVNLREELVRHDREMVARAIELLSERGEQALEAATQLLKPVLGVDDGLDRALATGANAKSLLREVRRVAAHLGGVSDDAPPQSIAL